MRGARSGEAQACVHGAYNFDGSCCTCGAPNARARTGEAVSSEPVDWEKLAMDRGVKLATALGELTELAEDLDEEDNPLSMRVREMRDRVEEAEQRPETPMPGGGSRATMPGERPDDYPGTGSMRERLALIAKRWTGWEPSYDTELMLYHVFEMAHAEGYQRGRGIASEPTQRRESALTPREEAQQVAGRCARCSGTGSIWKEWDIPDADGDTHGVPADCPECPLPHVPTTADGSPVVVLPSATVARMAGLVELVRKRCREAVPEWAPELREALAEIDAPACAAEPQSSGVPLASIDAIQSDRLRPVGTRDVPSSGVDMTRYQDFVHDLASRAHDPDCDCDRGDCSCVVGEAADCVMGLGRWTTHPRTR